jgi:hypothetical protein
VKTERRLELKRLAAVAEDASRRLTMRVGDLWTAAAIGEEDEIRRELAAVDPQPLLDAIAALEIALEPAPAPLDDPADVHAAHPPCDPHETLMDCPACRRGDRCDGFGPAKDPGEYAVPLDEVEDEIEEASRATGIPVPRAVRS